MNLNTLKTNTGKVFQGTLVRNSPLKLRDLIVLVKERGWCIEGGKEDGKRIWVDAWRLRKSGCELI